MTPAQQAALEVLVNRPLTTGEIALAEARDDGRLAAALSVGRTRRGSVSRADLTSWAATTGLRAAIEDHATDPASALRASALSIRDVLMGASDGIDFGRASNVALLAAWVAAGVAAQGDADALLLLAEHADPVAVDTVSAILNGA